MAYQNFKTLFAKVEKQVKQFRRNQSDSVLLLMDNYNILANSCDSESPELDLVETVNELLSYAQND